MPSSTPIVQKICVEVTALVGKLPEGKGPVLFSLGLPNPCERLIDNFQDEQLKSWIKTPARSAGYRHKKMFRSDTEKLGGISGDLQAVVLSKEKFPTMNARIKSNVAIAFSKIVTEQLTSTFGELENLSGMQVVACFAPEQQKAFIDAIAETFGNERANFTEQSCDPQHGYNFRLWTYQQIAD